MDFNALRKELKQSAYPTTYKKGFSYYEAGKVKLEDIFDYGDLKRIDSRVIGTDIYDVNVGVKNNSLVDCTCTCPAHYEYEGLCKHIVATVLQYIDDFEVYNDRKTDADIFLKNIKNIDESENFSNNKKLDGSLVWVITPSNRHIVKYKLDVLLDVDGELNNINLEMLIKEYWENNFYVINGNSVTFSSIDEMALNFLKSISKTNYYDYNYNKIYDSNGLLNVKDEFEKKISYILSKYSYIFIYENDELHRLDFVQGEIISPQVLFLKNENDVSVKIIRDDHIRVGKFLYINDEDQIFYSDYQDPFITMTNGLSSEFTIPFSVFKNFYYTKYKSLSNLNKIYFDDNINNLIIKGEFDVCVKFYYDNKKVYCEYYYKYGDYILGKEIGEDVLLDRDYIKENKFNSLLIKHGFRVSDHENLKELRFSREIFNFLTKGIEEFVDLYNVEISKSIKNLLIDKKELVVPTFTFDEQQDNIKVDLGYEHITNEDLRYFLESDYSIGLFHTSHGKIVKLSKTYLKMVRSLLLLLMVNPDNIKREFSVNKAYIYSIVNSKNPLIKRRNIDDRCMRIYKEMENFSFNNIEIPSQLDGILRDYQLYGFRWISMLNGFGFGGILADDMGLGKTLQTLSFIQSLNDNKKPILIACPTTLLFNWEKEINKFTPNLTYQIINGNKDERLEKINRVNDYIINITSYPLIRNDRELYMNYEFSYCFFDEAQYLKNYKSQVSVVCSEIRSIRKYALTGTPIENNTLEIWSLFNILIPGYLGKITNFKKMFYSSNASVESLNVLHTLLEPFILRRTKKEVLKELPDKIVDNILIDLSSSQKTLYSQLIEEYRLNVREEINQNNLSKSYITILALLTRLRQLCCHPQLIDSSLDNSSSKMSFLEETLDELLSENRKVIIFSQFKSMLDIIGNRLSKKGIDYCYLHGSIPEKKRREIIERFDNNGPNIFLISIKAGGTGLNLTSADTVVIFDPWWNPQVENQAIDRTHRIGQTKNVHVIRIITKDTIEEKIMQLQEEKANLANMLITSDKGFISKLSADEILDLFTKTK